MSTNEKSQVTYGTPTLTKLGDIASITRGNFGGPYCDSLNPTGLTVDPTYKNQGCM